MADPIDTEGPWEPEPHIPDGHVLYMRVSAKQFTELDGKPVPDSGAFKNVGDESHEPGMSTDWCRYASPHDTRMGAIQKPPEEYGVISLPVGAVRAIPKQRVQHTPIFHAPGHPRNNRAHTDVFGPKTKDDLAKIEQDAGEASPETPNARQAAAIRRSQEATKIRNLFQTYASIEIMPTAPLGVGNERRKDCQPD